jgi:8-oxo-dGTP pyrophosphatase MutT (NUDIX family)
MNKEGSTSRDSEDCFLCNFFPFLRAIFPPSSTRDVFEDPIAASGSPTLAGSAATPQSASNSAATPQEAIMASEDFRAFLFAQHAEHGFLLLHCTRKKKKPNHFQLPGGHVDDFEFKEAAKISRDPKEQLLYAAKLGASREFFEETGLDIRKSLDRLEPAKLYTASEQPKNKLPNEYKHRLFFNLYLTDDDFLKEENIPVAEAAFLKRPMGAKPPKVYVSSKCGLS